MESLFIVRRGRIKLERATLEGNSVILQMALAGDLLAEASLFVDHYHCSAIADSKVVALSSFSRHALLHACHQSATTAMQLAELFAHRIRKLRTLLEIRNIRAANARILAYLRSEANRNQQVALTMTYRDMAYLLGLAHETLYRTMKSLEAEGNIRKERNTIIILR